MFWTNIVLAWREISGNLMRSILTILGIVIGVAAVIVMVTAGNGATANVTNEISGLGRNLVVLSPGAARFGGRVQPAGPLTIDDAEAIRDQITSVAATTAVVQRAAQVVYGNENISTSIIGADSAYYDVRDWEIVLGRRFTAQELIAARPVCALGETPRKALFGAQDPIGEQIRIGNIACTVIGVMEEKGQSTFGQDQDDFILAPLRLVQRRLAGNPRAVSYILMSAISDGATARAQRDVQALMRERRNIAIGEEDDFTVQDLKEVTQIISSVTGILTALLSAVAAISLLVGGIGIMNIMLVSVTERTREIGIRLAIGALERDVLTQFLVEAAMLAALGGMLGVLFGIGLSYLVVSYFGWPFIPSPTIMVIAVIFSAGVGLVFGFFPARRAARLDPIDALRYE